MSDQRLSKPTARHALSEALALNDVSPLPMCVFCRAPGTHIFGIFSDWTCAACIHGPCEAAIEAQRPWIRVMFG